MICGLRANAAGSFVGGEHSGFECSCPLLIRREEKMRFQTVRTRPDIRHAAAHRSLQTVGAEHCTDCRRLYEESAWRCPSTVDGDILISRWVDGRSFHRYEKTVSPSDRYVIGVALKTTRLKFTRGPQTIFDGIMPAGTLHVTGPSRLLIAEFSAPCDFI